MRTLHIPLLLLFVLCKTGGFLGSEPAMAIEEAPYSVIEKTGDFEIRQYSSYFVAETYVQGDYDEAGSEGFRRLFDYIGGQNRSGSSIAMTAPVSQESGSRKIAMTAPVGQERKGSRWRITFVMPSDFTRIEALPRPNDDRVALVREPARLVAAVRYSGTWSRSRYQDHKAKLLAWIGEKNWKTAGEPVWARYDPPFMPWFLRRNEVLIPVVRH